MLEGLKKLAGKVAHKAKAAAALVSAGALAAVTAVCASAEDGANAAGSGLASASDQIVNQFTSAANDITPIIIGVLGAGLGIFVIFVGIKRAKKMFSTVAK